jgi:hypothetical protein
LKEMPILKALPRLIVLLYECECSILLSFYII